MLKSEILEMIDELRQIIGGIKGVKSVQERFGVSFLVVVSNEEERENVNKVAEKLGQQADNYGFDLDITAATESEVDQAKKLAANHVAKQLTFQYKGD